MTNLPFSGKFKCTCEYRRKGNWAAGFHTGIDLVGLSSKNVYSVCDGTVIMAKTYGDYGKSIKVKDNKTGKVFLFAHLASFAVKVGQEVTRVTKLGIMGNTGNSTGPHLHIEMRTANDKYGEVEDITAYMGIANKVGSYDSKDFQLKKDSISYEVHIEGYGWQDERFNGELAGTTGESRRIEAIKIFSNIPLKYRVHMQDKGWGEYVSNACMAGTTGESRRIEAIEIESASKAIRAQAHVEGLGWQDPVEDTHIVIGTERKALRLEALKLEYI